MTDEPTTTPIPKNQYLLHFVGCGLYSQKAFRDEAATLGVNRAFPAWLIKNAKLEYGKPILLGDWHKDKTVCKTVSDKQGRARIWGAFQIEQVNVSGDKDLKDEFAKLTDVERITVEREVRRICGSYTVETIAESKMTLQQLTAAWQEAQTKLGKKGKLFLSGKYFDTKFETEVTEPVGFSRAGLLVDYEELSIGAIAKPLIGFLGNYAQRKYPEKEEKPEQPKVV